MALFVGYGLKIFSFEICSDNISIVTQISRIKAKKIQ
jgi:hypothetical protein